MISRGKGDSQQFLGKDGVWYNMYHPRDKNGGMPLTVEYIIALEDEMIEVGLVTELGLLPKWSTCPKCCDFKESKL